MGAPHSTVTLPLPGTVLSIVVRPGTRPTVIVYDFVALPSSAVTVVLKVAGDETLRVAVVFEASASGWRGVVLTTTEVAPWGTPTLCVLCAGSKSG